MTTVEVQNPQRAPHSPQGHLIGFVETPEGCQAIMEALRELSVAENRIVVFHDDSGWQDFERMMKTSLWGEEAERVLAEGEQELHHGHFVISIAVKDRDEGLVLAKACASQGGFGFGHFGILMDERLTR